MARFTVLIETLSEGSCTIRVRAVDGFYLPPGRDVSVLVDPHYEKTGNQNLLMAHSLYESMCNTETQALCANARII
jgi:hypothetical protein